MRHKLEKKPLIALCEEMRDGEEWLEVEDIKLVLVELCEEAGVNSPRPIQFYRNILVMTFIGDDGVPAPLLREREPDDSQAFYDAVLEEMRLLWQRAGLAHGDLSEYNIMNQDDKPVIFDVSQAMLTIHRMAPMLIERDIENINSYFRRVGAETRDPEELREWITGGAEDLYTDT